MLPALALVLGLPLLLAPLAATPAAAATVPVTVALDVSNVYGLSTRDKTYRAEGILRVSAPAAAVRRWVAAGVEPSIAAALARAHQALADGSAWARLEALRGALSEAEG